MNQKSHLSSVFSFQINSKTETEVNKRKTNKLRLANISSKYVTQ